MSGVEVRLVDDAAELRRLGAVLDQIWGSSLPVVTPEVLRALAHTGGYVAAAHDGAEIVGGSVGFLARHRGEPALHSQVTGVVAGLRGSGVGHALKRHQRAWAAAQGLGWITWTFDPLVRRNAWFNLQVLGARVEEYLVDFYGRIGDAINGNDETDRLLVAWAVAERDDTEAPSGPAPTIEVPTPDDIVALRRTDPDAAMAWRRRLRRELGTRLAAGGRVLRFTLAGTYVVTEGAPA